MKMNASAGKLVRALRAGFSGSFLLAACAGISCATVAAGSPLPSGTVAVSSSVQNNNGNKASNSEVSTDGSLRVALSLLGPISATAAGIGGIDPSLTIGLTGAPGTPFDQSAQVYNAAASVSYSFDLVSSLNNFAQSSTFVDLTGSVVATNGFPYPGTVSVTTDASSGNLIPAGPGGYALDGGFTVLAPGTTDIDAPIFIVTNHVYTVTLNESIQSLANFSDSILTLDPILTVDPKFMNTDPGAELLYSPGFGGPDSSIPPINAVPEPSVWGWAGATFVLAVLVFRSRLSRVGMTT
jgi:hypothetical protein